MHDKQLSTIKEYILKKYPNLNISNELIVQNYERLNDIYINDGADSVDINIKNNQLQIIQTYELVTAPEQYTQMPEIESGWQN